MSDRAASLESQLQPIIDQAWEDRAATNTQTTGTVRDAILATIEALDAGHLRITFKQPDHPKAKHGWVVREWVKKAILLYFKVQPMVMGESGPHRFYDKVPNKYQDWNEERFREAGIRVLPGAIARKGSYLAPGVVQLPSFVNIGAFVDNNSMIDTWATVGSCAQIGKNVHLSGGTGIGGVLEPLQATPVIIEDDCFIGARAEVAEGVVVGEGSVISMGVYIGQSTRIIDRATGKVHMGYIPPYSVVVSGTQPGKPLPDGSPGPNLYCAVIVKTVDAQTRSKTSLTDLLREF
ncbi:MAG: 2,3,4,5-tetrahydropyridine-2,6-dicarboxylate N-succinyltransferase [Magnetococcales bacterium]|nr:2,3,4,5-tetrahydropyridine-2,6-dicarboxylate N-succinyltransferase [Magnetococcales bacterium]NGZ26875.1 2,3,4,5-tetrahydropyridine-2,6-dicarboxylate N-succinyltransferase [Magnetococcales bacterium]